MDAGEVSHRTSGPAARRERALAGFIAHVARYGYRDTRVDRVCRDVGISSRDFYTWFTTKERCYLMIFSAFANYVMRQADQAFATTDGPWEDRLRAALVSAVDHLRASPRMIRFVGELYQVEHGRAVLTQLVGRYRRLRCADEWGRETPADPVGLADRGEPVEAIVASVAAGPILRYLRDGRSDDLPELVPWIVYHLSLDLLDPDRAARLLPRDTRSAPSFDPGPAGSPRRRSGRGR